MSELHENIFISICSTETNQVLYYNTHYTLYLRQILNLSTSIDLQKNFHKKKRKRKFLFFRIINISHCLIHIVSN